VCEGYESFASYSGAGHSRRGEYNFVTGFYNFRSFPPPPFFFEYGTKLEAF
jgi:hypothetical protein